MEYTTYAEVNLDQFAQNFQHVQQAVGNQVGICVLAKANAYGHGMLEISRKAEKLGAACIAVATVEEGKALREAGIITPVLSLNAILPQSIGDAIRHNITMTVFSLKSAADILSVALQLGLRAEVHIQMDTGMNRVGVGTMEELESILLQLKNNKSVLLTGMYTHFAESDAPEKSFAKEQYARFMQGVDLAKKHGFSPVLHASNSGGVLDLPYARLDMVRPGLMLYGYYPSKHVKRDIQIKPVMSVYTHIVQVHTIPAGVSIGYDRTWVSKRETRIATIPIGYGDGYKRLLSNRAQAIICGEEAPVVGRISMDLAMLDVTGLADVSEGTKVVLLGSEKDASVTADDMADWAQTISYEILLSFSQRVPRVYIENGVRL
ncbi:MAG: alanine racemase [Christensenellales bacterium]